MKSILVVDDDPGIRLILRRYLEREGYSVEEAREGVEALALAEASLYDLVITDLIMPGKEGLETIKELLALHPALKIIAVSGGGVLGSNSCLNLARRFGAARTFSKPFDVDELLEAVNELI